MVDQRIYCGICHQNFDDDQFNYLYNIPVCFECADSDDIDKEMENG
jgi:hypothetical protein